MYLVSEKELKDLGKNEIKAEDLIKPERQVLITWSGEDIKDLLEQEENLPKYDLEEVIASVEDILSDCDCAICIETALDFVIDELRREDEENNRNR